MSGHDESAAQQYALLHLAHTGFSNESPMFHLSMKTKPLIDIVCTGHRDVAGQLTVIAAV